MTTFFTSDTHFSHSKIIEYCNRPFANADEMNHALITNWNNKVSNTDDIYILGDVFFCKMAESIEILSQLNGKIHVVLGNHDKVIHDNQTLKKKFHHICPPLYEKRIDDISVVMCHFPLLTWNKSHRGAFMLYGHAHGGIPFDPTVRRMDVGVDCHNYAPVSWEEIKLKLLNVPVQELDSRNSY